MAILDSDGTAVVQYKYDAWGRQIGCDVEAGNSNATALSTLNPFRYRGYVYDEEMGLYYLRSRYYSAFNGRFINADALINATPCILIGNQYSYCSNHPVDSVDSDGYLHLSGPHKKVQEDYINWLRQNRPDHIIGDEIGFFKWGDTGAIGRADIVDFRTGEVWEIKPCGITFLRDPLQYCINTLDQLAGYVGGTVRNSIWREKLCGRELQPGQNLFVSDLVPYSDTEEIIYWSTGDGIIWYALFSTKLEPERRTQRHTELQNLTNLTWLAAAAGAGLLFGPGGGGKALKKHIARWDCNGL